jgi:hypothetical protein
MKPLLFLLWFLIPIISRAQVDSAFILKLKTLDTADILKADTLTVPDDMLTKKIRELNRERSGLTIQNILAIKIMEEREKDKKHSADFYNKLNDEITKGRTATLIENTIINSYRRTFTEVEIDDLIRFYKSTAGKKMDNNFLYLLAESAKGAEQLLKLAAQRIEQK